MKRLLFLTIFCGTIFANSGLVSKSGVGLYIDAAYAPSWRECFPVTPIVYTPSVNDLNLLGPLFQDLAFTMNQNPDVYSPGVVIRADLSANRKASLQSVFYGFYEWKMNRANFVNEIKVSGVMYQESFNSVAISYLKHLSPRYCDYVSLSVLFGVRGMQQNNQINLSQSASTGVEGSINDIFAQINVNNVNRLIGLELGGIFRYRLSKRVYLEIPIKGGTYANLLDSSESLGGPALDLTLPTSYYFQLVTEEDKTRTFFGASGEVAPHLEIHLGNMYLFIGGSYLYVYGVNQGINQIQRNDIYRVQACDSFAITSVLGGVGVHF